MIVSEKCGLSMVIIAWIISVHLTHFAFGIDCNLDPKNNDGKLRKSLLCKYDKTIHPSLRGDPVNVTLRMAVKGFSFDESQNVLSVSSRFTQTWLDDNLKWSPAEFNNITHFIESSKELWQPDLQLFNSDIASVHNEICKDSNCEIYPNGRVVCAPPCVHSARCTADFTAWPFDSINCSLHIGTWINAADEVDLRLSHLIIPVSDLQSQDKGWKMIKVYYEKHHGNYSGVAERYPSVEFTFLIERHSAEHIFAYIVPAMVMASINLITLWMSPELSQRLMLLAFNILSHFLYMQQLSWYVPFNGDTCPTIVLCFRDSLIITGFLLLNTVVVRGFTSCGLDVPNWIDSTTGVMGSNKFGQIFLSKSYLIDRQPLHSEQFEETDDANESDQKTLPTATIKPPTNKWALFARYIDRLLFIIVQVLYVCMYFTFLPIGYKFAEPEGDMDVVVE